MTGLHTAPVIFVICLFSLTIIVVSLCLIDVLWFLQIIYQSSKINWFILLVNVVDLLDRFSHSRPVGCIYFMLRLVLFWFNIPYDFLKFILDAISLLLVLVNWRKILFFLFKLFGKLSLGVCQHPFRGLFLIFRIIIKLWLNRYFVWITYKNVTRTWERHNFAIIAHIKLTFLA